MENSKNRPSLLNALRKGKGNNKFLGHLLKKNVILQAMQLWWFGEVGMRKASSISPS